jgi:hypothetical protein
MDTSWATKSRHRASSDMDIWSCSAIKKNTGKPHALCRHAKCQSRIMVLM